MALVPFEERFPMVAERESRATEWHVQETNVTNQCKLNPSFERSQRKKIAKKIERAKRPQFPPIYNIRPTGAQTL